nr:LysR substrate-binding domain-containing protein [Roseomonas sp. 18066]
MPPLVALRAFHALGLLGSLRLAGSALGVGHTVVARHVRNLEAALGVALVRPAGRGLALTTEGALLHARIAAPFSAIADAAAQVARRRRALTIRCVPGFAAAVLLPRLEEIRQLLPGRQVILHPALSRRHYATVEADVEIAYGDKTVVAPLRGEVLARPRLFPVAAPSLPGAMAVRSVDDLLRLPMLHDETQEKWRGWLAEAGGARLPHGTLLGSMPLALEAARLGQGVALGNALLIAEARQAGALVELLRSDFRPFAYYLVAEAARWEEEAVARFRVWLQGVLAQLLPGGDLRPPDGAILATSAP